MKILTEKYPKGTLKNQKTDGKYIDGYLYDNLKVMANKIVNDMTFLGIIFSSTLEVGTGKTVLATQIGEAWTQIMKEMHNIDVPFSVESVVWRPKELIERAFKVPKYSYILLDEWEDAHYWSELGITFRQFFRKCRQLNLFIMCIIPNWFQLPLGYAVSRSAFAIDVKFETGFTRGFFSFYSFAEKRKLYIEGKRNYNYRVVKPSFNGKFVDGYGVDKEKYMEAKRKDIENYDHNDVKVNQFQIRLENFIMDLKKLKKFTNKELAEILRVDRSTVLAYNRRAITRNGGSESVVGNYKINPNNVVPNPVVTEEQGVVPNKINVVPNEDENP